MLYHVTTKEAWYSIGSYGIDPNKSKGKAKLSWFVDARRIHWAILHVCKRHGVQLHDVVILECDLTVKDVKRASVKGLYNRKELTTLDQITTVHRVDDFSASPLEYKV